jgi:hypothetical protein
MVVETKRYRCYGCGAKVYTRDERLPPSGRRGYLCWVSEPAAPRGRVRAALSGLPCIDGLSDEADERAQVPCHGAWRISARVWALENQQLRTRDAVTRTRREVR